MTADAYRVYRPMLDLLGTSEGTDKGRGYNETLAYGAYTGGDRDLVAMTLDQIDELQTAMLAHPDNKWNSSALGRYQIVRTTLRKIRKKLKLSGRELFDEAMQDRMACFLLGGRGIDRWLAGKKTIDALILNLAKEWASLPTPEGKGYYSGQNASVSVKSVKSQLLKVRAHWTEAGGVAQAAPEESSAGALVGVGVAVATGTGSAAVVETSSYWGLALYGGLAALGVLAAYLVWRNRERIGDLIQSIKHKLSGGR